MLDFAQRIESKAIFSRIEFRIKIYESFSTSRNIGLKILEDNTVEHRNF